jgi:mono/diheme cytochrome c family protein
MEILPRRSFWVKLNLNCMAILCLVAFAAAPALAQSGGADTYKSKCAPCHGVDGLAATPAGKIFKAASFKDPAIGEDPGRCVDCRSSRAARTRCPALPGKLPDDQIKAVLAYIRTLEK